MIQASNFTADLSRVVVIGNPGNRRLALLAEALVGLGWPPARLVPWIDVLAGRTSLPEVLQRGDTLRVESPGQDFAVERALLALGAEIADEDGAAYARLDAGPVHALDFERGRILPLRQWYLGFRAALRQIEAQRAPCPTHRTMNATAEIATMFDKRATHALLAASGVAVPPALAPISSYEELRSAMADRGWGRVFVKPAHGSSASGVVAYQTSGTRQQAISSVEMVRMNGEPRLYNSRRIRTYDEPREIAVLIDTVCRQRVHVERWLPKAGQGAASFDLRVVAIAGRARHTVVRTSQSPMTNLHLLNARGDLAAVRAGMGEARWGEAMATCERAMAAFPRSLYAGIDLLIAPDYRGQAVLEVNAFGDLLPGVLDAGQDTYTAELRALHAADGAGPGWPNGGPVGDTAQGPHGLEANAS